MTKKNKFIKHLPNILSLTNLSLGFVAIFIIINKVENARIYAPILIICGAILDTFDGYIARRFDAQSDIGKQLDSFADLITFGVAPAVLFTNLSIFSQHPVLIGVLCIYAVSGAYRLARYNIGEFTYFFMGLPITASGVVLAAFKLILTSFDIYLNDLSQWLFIFLILILSVLMVSKIKVKRLLLPKNSK